MFISWKVGPGTSNNLSAPTKSHPQPAVCVCVCRARSLHSLAGWSRFCTYTTIPNLTSGRLEPRHSTRRPLTHSHSSDSSLSHSFSCAAFPHPPSILLSPHLITLNQTSLLRYSPPVVEVLSFVGRKKSFTRSPSFSFLSSFLHFSFPFFFLSSFFALRVDSIESAFLPPSNTPTTANLESYVIDTHLSVRCCCCRL